MRGGALLLFVRVDGHISVHGTSEIACHAQCEAALLCGSLAKRSDRDDELLNGHRSFPAIKGNASLCLCLNSAEVVRSITLRWDSVPAVAAGTRGSK